MPVWHPFSNLLWFKWSYCYKLCLWDWTYSLVKPECHSHGPHDWWVFATGAATVLTNGPCSWLTGLWQQLPFLQCRLKWTDEGLSESSPGSGAVFIPCIWAARAKWPRLQRETLGLFRTTETLMLGTWSLKISVSGQHPNVRQCDNKGKGTLKSDRLVLWPHSWAFFEPQISHWITILQSSCEDQRQCLFTYNVCALLKCVYSSIFPNIFCFLRAGTHFFFFFASILAKFSKVPNAE